MLPVYLPGIRSEARMRRTGFMATHLHLNVDRAAGTFSLSVNGKAITRLTLEPFVPA